MLLAGGMSPPPPPHVRVSCQVEEAEGQVPGWPHLQREGNPEEGQVKPPQAGTLTAGVKLAPPLVSRHPVLHFQL